MPIKKSRPKPTGLPGIKQDGPNRFLVCRTIIDPRTGQRRKKEGVAASFAEAVTLWEKLLTELQAGAHTKTRSRQRFADYVNEWVDNHLHRMAKSTQTYYTNSLAHLVVYFGQFYVNAIQAADIREWRTAMEKKEYQPKPSPKNPEPLKRRYSVATINGWHRVLRNVLEDAKVDGALKENPARQVKTLSEGKTRGRRGTSLGRLDFISFLETVEKLSGKEISPDVARMFITAAWTGMRAGELLALRWVDVVDGELRVERSVHRRSEKATKTDDPRRVTIVEPLERVLTEQRQWLFTSQHPGLESGLIFPASPRHAKAGASRRRVDEVSWYRSSSVFHNPLEKVVAKAGIPAISMHSLRRTFENLQRKAGVEQLVRRAVSGWRTEEAQGIYATVDREDRDRAAAAVAKYVFGKNS